MLTQLSWSSLIRRPISLFVVGLLIAIVASELFGRFYLTGAQEQGTDFLKVVMYYLLLVAVVNSTNRLQGFIGWLCVLVTSVAAIAVLQYHEMIQLPGMEICYDSRTDPETGLTVTTARIQGTGIFNDPNDLAMLMVFGLMLLFYAISVPRWRAHMPLILGSIAMLFYAFVLTASRGGLMALIAGSITLFQSRYGWKRAIPICLVALPVMLLLVGGRQAGIASAVQDDTGQQRIQIWGEGLALFRQHPLFGIGKDQYAEKIGHVAHNSYVHAYTELGFLGGTLFLCAFAYPVWAMYRLGDKRRVNILQPQLVCLRPFLQAAIVGYAFAMFSLSRCYIVPTFLVVGLATVYLRLVHTDRPLPELHLNQRLVNRLAFASVAFLAVTYAFVRVFARYGG